MAADETSTRLLVCGLVFKFSRTWKLANNGGDCGIIQCATNCLRIVPRWLSFLRLVNEDDGRCFYMPALALYVMATPGILRLPPGLGHLPALLPTAGGVERWVPDYTPL
jgi:hypothetical protein